MHLGPRFRRILAALIDLPISLLCMLSGLAAALLADDLTGTMQVPEILDLVAGFVLVLGPHAAFYILLTGSRGATPGKAIMQLKIVDAAGGRPSLGQASKRYLGQVLADVCLGLGHLPAFIRKDRRSLADLLAGTRVVEAAPATAPGAPDGAVADPVPPMAPLVRGLVVAGALLLVWLFGSVAVRFGELLQYSKESSTKGNLTTIRSAISIYYADMEGLYPQSLSTAPDSPFSRYLEKLPAVMATHAGVGRGRRENPAGAMVLYTIDETITVTGRGWRYNPATGRIFVNSCATDMKGLPYSCYGY